MCNYKRSRKLTINKRPQPNFQIYQYRANRAFTWLSFRTLPALTFLLLAFVYILITFPSMSAKDVLHTKSWHTFTTSRNKKFITRYEILLIWLLPIKVGNVLTWSRLSLCCQQLFTQNHTTQLKSPEARSL